MLSSVFKLNDKECQWLNGKVLLSHYVEEIQHDLLLRNGDVSAAVIAM